MTLPQVIFDFFQERAAREGHASPGPGDDLFQTGLLDSFSLLELVTTLEDQCQIKVPDADVQPAKFRTIEAIESYVESRRGQT